jgi:hypothetical protein
MIFEYIFKIKKNNILLKTTNVPQISIKLSETWWQARNFFLQLIQHLNSAFWEVKPTFPVHV